MGAKKSKSITQTKVCDCTNSLIIDAKSKVRHCCRHECFYEGMSNEKMKQLKHSLNAFNAVHILFIILKYLPNPFDLQIDSRHNTEHTRNLVGHYGIEMYRHQETQMSLCSIWLASQKQQIKIVVLGSAAVGKTALTLRFINRTVFLDEYDPTIEDSYTQTIGFRNKNETINVTLEVLDTAGDTNYFSLTRCWEIWMNFGNFYLLLFSYSDKNSFEEVLKMRDRILNEKVNETNWGMMLVMTKSDLRKNNQTVDVKHIVDTKEVMNKVREWKIPYIETSAKENENVFLAFYQAVYEYWIQSQGVNKQRFVR